MEKAMVFKSMTAEVKYLIMEYMSERKDAVGRAELVQYVKGNVGADERLTDGVIAGALKVLLADGELVTVQRGCYQLGDGKAQETGRSSSFDRIYAICNKFKSDLDRACTVNLLTFTGEKKELYDLMAEDLKGLRDTVSVYTEKLCENIAVWNQKCAEELVENENMQPEAPVEEIGAELETEAGMGQEEPAPVLEPDSAGAEEAVETPVEPEGNEAVAPVEENPTEEPAEEVQEAVEAAPVEEGEQEGNAEEQEENAEESKPARRKRRKF